MTDESDKEMSQKEALKELGLRALGASPGEADNPIGAATPLGDPNWPQQISIGFDGFDEIRIDYEGETYEVVERDGELAIVLADSGGDTER